MGIETYFKQAYRQFRYHKLFCGVYILGTACAIAFVMVLVIVYAIKIAPVYPEINRNRMLYAGLVHEVKGDEYEVSSRLSYAAVNDYFYKLRTPEAVTAVMENQEAIVQVPGSGKLGQAAVKMTDASFWTVFPFRFIEGTHYTQGDFDSGVRTVVISSSMAHRLFGKRKAAGEFLSVDFVEYRVSGVVEDASRLAFSSYAEVWIPYSSIPANRVSMGETNMVGPFSVYMLAKKVDDIDAVRKEVLEIERKVSVLHPQLKFDFYGQPDTHLAYIARNSGEGDDPDVRGIVLKYGIAVFILLLIPAVNLVSITSSRIEKRISELGVRKAFGAGKGTIIKEMLAENFIYTLVGGAIGLLISYFLIALARNWIFDIESAFLGELPEGADVVVSFGMLFNPVVFFITLLVCIVINLLSTLLPAWRFSGRNIVDLLNNK